MGNYHTVIDIYMCANTHKVIVSGFYFCAFLCLQIKIWLAFRVQLRIKLINHLYPICIIQELFTQE